MAYASSKSEKKDFGKSVSGYNEHVAVRGSSKSSSRRSPSVSGFGRPASGKCDQVPVRGGSKSSKKSY